MTSLRSFTTVSLIVVCFAILAMAQIPRESPWWDEIITLSQLRAPTFGAFIDGVKVNDPTMAPLYYTVAYYYAKAAGDSLFAMRALSVFAGLGSILLIWRLATKMLSSQAGLIAALLMSLSLSHHYYSVEIRTYPFTVLIVMGAMYGLWRAVDESSRFAWGANMVLNALAVANHLFAVFILPAQGLYVLIFAPKRWRTFSLWCVAQGPCLALATIWVLMGSGSGQMLDAATWIPPAGLRDFASALLLFTGGRPIQAGSSSHLPLGMSLEIPLALLFLSMMAMPLTHWISDRRIFSGVHWNSKEARTWAFLILWASIPAVLLFMGSVWKPMFVPRYVLYSAPAYPIAAALAIVQIRKTWFRRGILAALLLCSGWQLVSLCDGPVRPDWKNATEYLKANVQEKDTVVPYRQLDYTTCIYYRPVVSDRITLAEKWSDVGPRAREAHERGGSAWVIVWMWTPPEKIERSLKEAGLSFTARDFCGWPGLRIYNTSKTQ